jgi:hypothetical protein
VGHRDRVARTLIDRLKNKTPAQVVQDVLDRKQFNLGAHGANILAKPIVAKNVRVILVTCGEVARELEGTYLTAVTQIGDAWQIASSVAGGDASVLFVEKARRLIPEGAVASPSQKTRSL